MNSIPKTSATTSTPPIGWYKILPEFDVLFCRHKDQIYSDKKDWHPIVDNAELIAKLARAERALLAAGYTDCGDEWKPPIRNAREPNQAPAPKPVTEAELLRAMDQFGCAPLVVNAQSVGFVNYFIANRDSSWHWRQENEGAKSCD